MRPLSARSLSGIVILLALCLGSAPSRASGGALCKKWFRLKKLDAAAHCFRDLIKQWDGKKKLAKEERYQLGIHLRNAALVWSKLADTRRSAAYKAFARERALRYIQRFVHKRFYETAIQRRFAVVFEKKLKDAIGYGQLTLTGVPSRAQVTVSGFRYQRKGRGILVHRLRPGRYTVLVQQGDRSQARSISLKPQQHRVVDFTLATAPPRAPQSGGPAFAPALTWSILGAGALLAAGSAALIGVAVATNADMQTQQRNAKARLSAQLQVGAEDTRAISEAHAASNQLLVLGIVCGSVGLVTLLVGSVLHVQKSHRPDPPAAGKGPNAAKAPLWGGS